jgi:hypothetical protein
MYEIKKDELFDNFEIYCYLCQPEEVSNALTTHIFDDTVKLSISLEYIEEEGDDFVLTYLKEGKEEVLKESKEWVLSQGMVNSGKYKKTLTPEEEAEKLLKVCSNSLHAAIKNTFPNTITNKLHI